MKLRAEKSVARPFGLGRISAAFGASSLVLIGVGGCAADSAEQKSAGYQATERALHDPMNYSPGIDKTDISGGGPLDLDRQGLRKDMDSVLLR